MRKKKIKDEMPESIRLKLEQFRHHPDQSDPEVRGLFDKYTRGKKLILRPNFQRNAVWDIKTASMLIESLILGIPIPMIYFSETIDGLWETIDGQQRLHYVFEYIKGKYSLKGLEKLNELNGKFFSDLVEPLQEKIKSATIRTVVINKESDENLKYLIFERLNKGVVALNEQESRNCYYRGKYNDCLKKLAENKKFIELITGGSKIMEERLIKRLTHVEYVLRFASLFHNEFNASSLKTFMENDMAFYSKPENFTKKEEEKLKKAFRTTVNFNYSLFKVNGKIHAFRKYNEGSLENKNGGWKRTLNKILYELAMVSFAKYSMPKLMQHKNEIREAWINFIKDAEFLKNTYNGHTANKLKVTQRFNEWNAILGAIMISEPNPRLFSKNDREILYRKDPTCAFCQQDILDIDDAVVDHVVQYHQGGLTNLENGRLAHRYCNNTRPRTEIVMEKTEEVLDVDALDDNELSEEFVKMQEELDIENQYKV